jgi:hypothetical protein
MRTGGPDVVHYGQKVRVRLHPGAGALAAGTPVGPQQPGGAAPHLALASAPVGMAAVARFSKHQLVMWTAADGGSDTIWCAHALARMRRARSTRPRLRLTRAAPCPARQVLTPDPAMQLAAEGQPVMARRSCVAWRLCCCALRPLLLRADARAGPRAGRSWARRCCCGTATRSSACRRRRTRLSPTGGASARLLPRRTRARATASRSPPWRTASRSTPQ